MTDEEIIGTFEIFEKDFLEKDDVNELKVTPEGRRAIGLWIHREKYARAIAALIIELKVDLPSKEEQERLTALLFRMTSPAMPIWELLEEMTTAEKTLTKYSIGTPLVSLVDAKGNA